MAMARVTKEEIEQLNGYAELKGKFEDIKPESISSIVGNGKGIRLATYQDVISILLQEKDNIASILDADVSITNFSGMLHGTSKHVREGIKALVDLTKPGENNSQSTLQKLKDNGFTANNLSSIMSGAGRHLPEVIKVLEDLIKPGENDTPSRLDKIKARGVSIENLSSMMKGVCSHLSEGIKALENFIKPGENNSPSTLEQLKAYDFLTDDISSIMHASGKNLPKVELQMKKCLKKDERGFSRFDYLISAGVTPAEIAHYANGKGKELDKILKEIEKMPHSTTTLGKMRYQKTSPSASDKTTEKRREASAEGKRVLDATTQGGSSEEPGKMPATKKQKTNPKEDVPQEKDSASASQRMGQGRPMNESLASRFKTGTASAIRPQDVKKREEDTPISSRPSLTPKKPPFSLKAFLEKTNKSNAAQGKGSPSNFRG